MDMSKSQRHTRSGASHGVSQANGSAVHPKLAEKCHHEVVSGILKKWKQCGVVQASYGCLVGHVCMGVRISKFAPQLCNASVSGLDEYMSMQIDSCLEKEQIGTLFVWVGAPERGFRGGGGHMHTHSYL